MNDYEAFVRTLTSPRCHLAAVENADFSLALARFAAAAAQLDDFKRTLFYGQQKVTKPEPGEGAHDYEVVHSDVLHGLIGLATESGELVERLQRMIADPDNKEHRVNLLEELGDVAFYFTMITSALGASLHEVLTLNQQKLRTRYESQFTAGAAIRRNLQREAQVLGIGAQERSN